MLIYLNLIFDYDYWKTESLLPMRSLPIVCTFEIVECLCISVAYLIISNNVH